MELRKEKAVVGGHAGGGGVEARGIETTDDLPFNPSGVNLAYRDAAYPIECPE